MQALSHTERWSVEVLSCLLHAVVCINRVKGLMLLLLLVLIRQPSMGAQTEVISFTECVFECFVGDRVGV